MGAALRRATAKDCHHVGLPGCHGRRRHRSCPRHRRSHGPHRDPRSLAANTNHNIQAFIHPHCYHGAPTTIRGGLPVAVVEL